MYVCTCDNSYNNCIVQHWELPTLCILGKRAEVCCVPLKVTVCIWLCTGTVNYNCLCSWKSKLCTFKCAQCDHKGPGRDAKSCADCLILVLYTCVWGLSNAVFCFPVFVSDLVGKGSFSRMRKRGTNIPWLRLAVGLRPLMLIKHRYWLPLNHLNTHTHIE